MPQVNITIRNLPQIRAAFNAAPRIMSNHFRRALTKSILLVQRESMFRTPVDTGRLRASHTFEISGSGLNLQASTGPTAEYGIFVHEGTRFMRPRPFLKEGAQAAASQIEMIFTQDTQSALEEIGRMT